MRGIIFGDKHSYKDYKMITNSVYIGMPEVKENYIVIPGGNGSLDLTEATGGVKYGDCNLEFQFTLQNAAQSDVKNIIADIHGKSMNIVIDDEPEYYFTGRCKALNYEVSNGYYNLSVAVKCKPYRYHVKMTVYKVPIAGKKELICLNDTMTVMPIITVTHSMIMELQGIKYLLESGKTYKGSNILFDQRVNRLKVEGQGVIEITYREGAI